MEIFTEYSRKHEIDLVNCVDKAWSACKTCKICKTKKFCCLKHLQNS